MNLIKKFFKAYKEGGFNNIWKKVKGAFINKFLILPPDRKRKLLDEYRQKYKKAVFVETGTFVGDTVDFLKDRFDRLYSIELSEELCRNAQIRFSKYSHISIIHGDSGEVLRELIPKLKEPALFWLDGHYSSIYHYKGNHYLTAKGKQESPVLQELNSIAASEFKHIILIDDARLFKGQNGYPNLKELYAFIRNNFKGYEIRMKADIIRITPKD